MKTNICKNCGGFGNEIEQANERGVVSTDGGYSDCTVCKGIKLESSISFKTSDDERTKRIRAIVEKVEKTFERK